MPRRIRIASSDEHQAIGAVLHAFPALHGETEGIGIGDASITGLWRFRGPEQSLDALQAAIQLREGHEGGVVLRRSREELSLFLIDPLPLGLSTDDLTRPVRLHLSWEGLFVEIWTHSTHIESRATDEERVLVTRGSETGAATGAVKEGI